MKSIVFCCCLVATLAGVQARPELAQIRPYDTTDSSYIPSNADIDELISKKGEITKVVDCMIQLKWGTVSHCRPWLEKYFIDAPSYYQNQQLQNSCKSCKEESDRILRIVRRISKVASTEYKRLLAGVQERLDFEESIFLDY